MGRARWIALPVLAAAVAGGSAATAAGAQTLTLLSVTTSQSGSGGAFVSHDVLFQAGRKVGTDVVRCRFNTSTHRATCRVLVVLTGRGTIRLRFSSAEGDTGGPLTVVGGTGQFQGATGRARYKNLNREGTRTRVVIHLT